MDKRKEGGDKEENRPDIVVKRVTKLPSSSLRSDVYNSKQPALLHPPTLIKPILTLNLTPEERMIGVKTATAASSCPPPHSPPYPDVLSERHCRQVRSSAIKLSLKCLAQRRNYGDVDFKKNLTRVLLTAV
ncbi:hypothetical protein C0Q70_14326 [Pomacea canaliculata]|uniref:Uncharacterized protein n=1 Tax=Pomacea canaliculata TaxID=400727 RepID=A0A2T7NZQ1_POMCA|nr:hypothetical protein C0Q70_14326 [Pomacea canaliculata]